MNSTYKVPVMVLPISDIDFLNFGTLYIYVPSHFDSIPNHPEIYSEYVSHGEDKQSLKGQ
jgi:hypothetical protein